MPREEKAQDDGDESDPLANLSPASRGFKVSQANTIAGRFSRKIGQQMYYFHVDERSMRSPEDCEQQWREAQEDVGDQQGCEHVRPPVRPIQDQQVAALRTRLKQNYYSLLVLPKHVQSDYWGREKMVLHVRAGLSWASPSCGARLRLPRPIKLIWISGIDISLLFLDWIMILIVDLEISSTFWSTWVGKLSHMHTDSVAHDIAVVSEKKAF